MSIASELTSFVSILGDRSEWTAHAENMLIALSEAGTSGSDAIRITASVLAWRVADRNAEIVAHYRKYPCEVSREDQRQIRERAEEVRMLRALAVKHTRAAA